MNTTKVNIRPKERLASIVLGGALLLRGLSKGSILKTGIAGVLLYRGMSGHSYLYEAPGRKTGKRRATQESSPEIERSITIEKPAEELERFWREPQRLSQIMGDAVEITPLSENRARWRLHGPSAQSSIEWDTQLIEDRPGKMLRWKSVDGTQLPNEVAVRFQPAPGDWGTEATLHVSFAAPGGAIGKRAAKRLGIVPRIFADNALRRFKSLAETGEVPTLKRNPSARAGTAIKEGVKTNASTLLERR